MLNNSGVLICFYLRTLLGLASVVGRLDSAIKTNHAICWIVIHLADSVIHLSNNSGQIYRWRHWHFFFFSGVEGEGVGLGNSLYYETRRFHVAVRQFGNIDHWFCFYYTDFDVICDLNYWTGAASAREVYLLSWSVSCLCSMFIRRFMDARSGMWHYVQVLIRSYKWYPSSWIGGGEALERAPYFCDQVLE